MSELIYFDNNATTKIDPRVLQTLVETYKNTFANPSAREHSAGENAHRLVKKSLRLISTILGCESSQITVTSGATEAVNQAICSICRQVSKRPARLLVNPLEHKAVIATCKQLSEAGLAEIVWLENDSEGNISLQEIESKAEECDAIIVMAANNELGNIYPSREIGSIADKCGCQFVCDASQAIGKVPFCFQDCKATYLIGSAHKFYGPKGIGFLVAENPGRLHPLFFGGGQQEMRRSGTLDVPSIAGMAVAFEVYAQELAEEMKFIQQLRDNLQQEIITQIPEAVVLGNRKHRLPGTLAIAFPGVPNDAVLARVSNKLAISTGSACTVGVEEPSHVYRSLGLEEKIVGGVLRLSVGRFNTQSEAELAQKMIVEAVKEIKTTLCDRAA